MKVTIKQIAKEANVSVTTVSNVVNNKAHRVSEEKRQLIQAIIEKYDYAPNMNARSLVKSSSRLIALLYYSHETSSPVDFSNPFVSEVLEGVERKVKELGYFTLIHNVSSVEEIQGIQNNWMFDGFIAVSFSQRMFKEIHQKIKGPAVFVDTHLEKKVFESLNDYQNRFVINTDDYTAGKDVTNFLIEQGHQQIAFLSYQYDENEPGVIQERFAGYSKALAENKLVRNDQFIFNEEQFDLMLENIENYSAVVVSADDLALQFMHFLKQNGRQVPEDISVISFDDIRYAAFSDPPLTTLRLNQINKGEQAMELLVTGIQQSETDIKQMISLPGEIMIRETVAKPKSIVNKNFKNK